MLHKMKVGVGEETRTCRKLPCDTSDMVPARVQQHEWRIGTVVAMYRQRRQYAVLRMIGMVVAM